jgi:glucoamylase
MRTVVVAVLAAAAAAVPASAAAQAPVRPLARGAPGARAVWTPADKHGFGTARARGSHVWFTLRQRELTEVFYPDLGTPALRELQFAVVRPRHAGFTRETDAATGRVQRFDDRGLTYRQTTTGRRGTWRLTKTVVTDPRRHSVLVRVDFASLDGKRYDVYLLADPALSNDGMDDRGVTRDRTLFSYDRRAALAIASRPALGRSASGYAGLNEPWRDVRADGTLDRTTDATRPGNVRQVALTTLTGRGAAGSEGRRLTLALGFGAAPASARRAADGSLHAGFDGIARAYARGWSDYLRSLKPIPASAAGARDEYEASALVLAADEDKLHPGAHVASPSMPWAWGLGTVERDLPSGPYHLVWSRDLYQAATAQIAAGDSAAARRGLDFLLFRQQRADGSFPQNSTVTGAPRWRSTQLDEVAFPIVLAWQLRAFDARRWARLKRAADYVVARGPVTPQERWENQEGWSPATIAAEVAGLVCAADIARRRGADAAARRYLATADRWAARVQDWTATTNGPYAPRPYYLRITKDGRPDLPTTYSIGDGGPARADQRAVVDPSFLELVRLGVKAPGDPVIVNSVAVVDEQLRAMTPQGPLWHRFSFDGYGERRDGGPWDLSEPDTGDTLGRLWPIFAGERGEYELAAGRTADAYLGTLAGSANDGDLIAEQVWDGRPPTGRSAGGRLGAGTRSATPLSWSHAQLIRLAWSIDAGRPVEQPAAVACRYVRRGC